MKGFNALFGLCLGIIGTCGAFGAVSDDTVRAASRMGAQGPASPTTIRPIPNITATQKNVAPQRNTSGILHERATIRPTSTDTQKKSGTTRTTTVPRAMDTNTRQTNTATTTSRTTNIAQSRPTVAARATTRPGATKSRTVSRTAIPTTRVATQSRTKSRAATITESGVLSTNYKRCREIYYECMDEFCAAKDANLRRCACSARANEFDGIKQRMSKIEDKMLNFNQNLLMVGMDAADVTAINQSTDGEDAFYATTDRTKSKRALDNIAKKLNTTFNDDGASGFSMAPISLSLNSESAFDTVDSFLGATTTAKSGISLYNAATPICRETALEVCDEDELALAQSGYQMLIEQDCNTVLKSYQSQSDQARAKVFESGALLDMSRLDAYQNRNSDDILECKRKMLDMLTDTTVCGTDLIKCLDMTGKYIDPTTGTAFLTTNLSDLTNLITRPSVNQTWVSANASGAFVNYLNGKKHYIETATENCQDIADRVWDMFIEDALAQIKLAQDAKLEEIRHACTQLTTDCLTNSYDSLEQFDARSLSIFGVMADRSANAMCDDIKQSCVALIGNIGDETWNTGMSEIATTKTYDTIISSCTQVGKNCIINTCKSISGNFGLCNDIYLSPNRHSILERTACWPEVLACVASAGNDAIGRIMAAKNLATTGDYNTIYSFYNEMYAPTNQQHLHNICKDVCGTATIECAKCRIAERIWGNCQSDPNTTILDDNVDQNKIIETQTGVETLLWWFANRTGTANKNESCVNTRCTSANTAYQNHDYNSTPICVSDADNHYITGDMLYCPDPNRQIDINNGLTNCCQEGEPENNICCTGTWEDNSGTSLCLPNSGSGVTRIATNGNQTLYCVNTSSWPSGNGLGWSDSDGDNETAPTFPGGIKVKCKGRLVTVENNKYSNFIDPNNNNNNILGVKSYYYDPGQNGTPEQTPIESTHTGGYFVGWTAP